MMEQAIENIPSGPVSVDPGNGCVVLPAKPTVYRSIEGLIQHFEVLMPNRPGPNRRSLPRPPNRQENWDSILWVMARCEHTEHALCGCCRTSISQFYRTSFEAIN